MRDPKAVLVSAWPFVRGVIGNVVDGDVTPDEFLDAFCSDRFLAGSCAEQAASWWPHPGDDPGLLLTFREMKADIARVQRRLEQLLGLTLDTATRAEVLRLASFDHIAPT